MRIVGDAVISELADRAEAARPEEASVVPLFRDVDVRRETWSVLTSVDVGVSAFAPSRGITSAARGGVRLFDFVDITAGVRLFEASRVEDAPRGIATAGLGLHGRFPRARSLALALGFEAGTGSAMSYASGTLGLRIAPLSKLWLGLYPIHPAYAAWTEGRPAYWTAFSSADLTFAF